MADQGQGGILKHLACSVTKDVEAHWAAVRRHCFSDVITSTFRVAWLPELLWHAELRRGFGDRQRRRRTPCTCRGSWTSTAMPFCL